MEIYENVGLKKQEKPEIQVLKNDPELDTLLTPYAVRRKLRWTVLAFLLPISLQILPCFSQELKSAAVTEVADHPQSLSLSLSLHFLQCLPLFCKSKSKRENSRIVRV